MRSFLVDTIMIVLLSVLSCAEAAKTTTTATTTMTSGGRKHFGHNLKSTPMFGGMSSVASSVPSFVLNCPRGGEVTSIETLETLDELKTECETQKKLIVIFFTRPMSKPNRVMTPVFKQISNQFPKVEFVTVDIDKNVETAESYNIGTATPIFLFIKNGKIVEYVRGASRSQLLGKIQRYKGWGK